MARGICRCDWAFLCSNDSSYGIGYEKMKEKEKWAREAVSEKDMIWTSRREAWIDGFEFALKKCAGIADRDYESGDRTSSFELLKLGEKEIQKTDV